MSDSNYLNGFDQVLAMTENGINGQFYLLCPSDNSGPIPSSFTYTDPDDPHGWQGMVVNQMAAPRVECTDIYQELTLIFSITSGSVNYYDYGDQASIDISGLQMSFTVDLGSLQIEAPEDLSSLALTDAASQIVTDKINSNLFSATALFLQITSSNVLASDVTINDQELDNSASNTVTTIIDNWLQGYIDGNGNPFLIGFNLQSLDPSQSNPSLPALAPQKVMFSDSAYQYSGTDDGSGTGLGTVNYLMMSNGHDFPSNPSMTFDFNWVTPASTPADNPDGTYAIETNLFRQSVIEDTILPQLAEALGVPSSTAWQKIQSTGQYTYNLSYVYEPYKNDHDGYGYHYGDDGPNPVYLQETETTYCSLIYKPGSNGEVTLNGSGYFLGVADYDEYWFAGGDNEGGLKNHMATTTSQTFFDIDMTIGAGTDGSVTFDATITQTGQSTVTDADSLVNFADWLGGLFGMDNTFKDDITDQNNQMATLQGDWIGNAQTDLDNGLGLANTAILPNGDIFSYSDMQLDDQLNLRCSVKYKSSV